jgi:hypothetical protein
MMKGIIILFFMYYEMQIFVIWNTHEFDVLMNGQVKYIKN